MRLIYGTTNPAKLASMREALSGLPFELAGLGELSPLPEVLIDESGDDPLENAVIKARAYYAALREPVFSCDSGLYLENLPAELQPGVHVRRVKGKSLSDEEMIAYYGGLARRYGTLRARYRNAICLIMGEGREYRSMDGALASEPFGLAERPYGQYQKGFPLDSLSVRLNDGRYYLELPPRERKNLISFQGFAAFLTRCAKAEERLGSRA